MKERLDSRQRREQIADAALKIVVEQGVGALTVRNLAGKVGTTPTALYRHYKNKAAILSTIIDHVEEKQNLNRRNAEANSDTPMEYLRLLFFQSIDFMEQYKAVPILFISDLLWLEEPQLGERLQRLLQKSKRDVSRVIEKGQRNGQIRMDISPNEIHTLFLSFYTTIGMLVSREVDDIQLKKQAAIHWMIFEESMSKTG